VLKENQSNVQIRTLRGSRVTSFSSIINHTDQHHYWLRGCFASAALSGTNYSKKDITNSSLLNQQDPRPDMTNSSLQLLHGKDAARHFGCSLDVIAPCAMAALRAHSSLQFLSSH